MRNICRVFIQVTTTLRSFYWFEFAPDHSLYFGSSNTREFRTGYAATSKVEIDGTYVQPMQDGRPMNQEEIKQKTSIHGSGIVNLPTGSEDSRDRYKIAPPRDGFTALPLVGILPIEPGRYPASAKIPKPSDLVLETTRYSSHPVGLLFYLTQSELTEPMPVRSAKSEYEAFATESIPFGDYRLCVSIYAQPSSLKHWPSHEIEVLGHPHSSGEEPSWPFFV